MNEQEIFEAALDKDPCERDPFVQAVCGEDSTLRSRIKNLLKHHEESGSFLANPAQEILDTQIHPITEQPGTIIGPYKLLQKIGEGGMGVVYMAEQTEPVKRRVALKIIKPGMDTKEVIARFEAERQALAMMDHPSIAKVLDAATTDSGRPYFVMELVKGLPITKYCDGRQLTPRERLELFLPICHAVQHAHQKGVIHRDLKPSNVLVAQYDDHAVPKIIDFGVAKATSQSLTEKTMFTKYGQILGTLEYMSPEQAQFNQLDVDTRSDVYSLGVLLYELLTGETPFDKERLRTAAFDEILRIIREEDPPNLSTKLSGSATLVDTAANRKTDPKKLSLLVRGELDWIVTKALEKDRGRRYETASAFAADVQHYLNGDAVTACPPSAAYRFRKFTQRNRIAIGTTAAVAASLIVGIAGTTWQAYQATQAEEIATERLGIVESQKVEIEKERLKAIAEAERADNEAEKAKTEAAIAQAINDFLNNDLLRMGLAVSQVEAHITPDPNIKLRTLVDRAAEAIEGRFADQPLVEAAIRQTLARTYRAVGALKEAERHSKRALELRRRELGREHTNTLHGMHDLAWVYHDQGRYAEAETLHQQVLEIQLRTRGDEHPATLNIMSSLADIYRHQGRYREAEELHLQAWEISRRVLGGAHSITLNSMSHLANVYLAQNRLAEAERIHQNGWRIYRRTLGAQHPLTLGSMNNLAKVYLAQMRYAEAEPLFQVAWEIRQRVLGDEHPETLKSVHDLAVVYYNQGRHAEAEEIHQITMELQRRILGNEHRDTLCSLHNLANVYLALNRHVEAERLFQNAWEIRRRVLGDEHPDTLKSMHGLAAVYQNQDRDTEAEQLFQKLIDIQRRVLGDEHPGTLRSMHDLAKVYFSQKRHAEAERLHQKAWEIRRRVLGDDHPDTLKSMHDLAVVYDHQERYAEAEELLQKTLEHQRRVLGDEHRDTLRSMYNLATVYRQRHRDDKAEPLYRESLEIFQRTEREHNPLTNRVRKNLASIYTKRTWALANTPKLEERNSAEAVRYARLALELKPDNPNHHSNLGVALFRDGQYEAAARAFETADKLREDPDMYHRMFYAMSEWQLDRPGRALELYREGADWMRAAGIENEEQIRFREEAEKLLGLSPLVKENNELPLKAPSPLQTTPKEEP